MLDCSKVCLTTMILCALTLPAAAAPCPVGDLNGDCVVDMLDLEWFAFQWLDDSCDERACADIAGDEGVDFLDFSRMLSNWGRIGAPLTISEFLASNSSTAPVDPSKGQLLDEDGDSSDWIEIYNPTDRVYNLGGWYLTDNSGNLRKWCFPSVNLNPGAFLVVFASGKDRAVAGAQLHTNFQLDATNPEYLALVGPDGLTIAHEYAPTYPPQLTDISYGLAQYATTLVTTGATVSYKVPTSSDASLNWTALTFNDTAWDKATTALGFAGAPTTSTDVGNPAAAGSFSVAAGVYTVQGDGTDIWGNADQFHYVYMPLSGDGQMTARVVSMTNTNSWAKAGVMVRESLEAGARHAMEVVTPGNGIDFQYRTILNGSSGNTGGAPGSAPYWVRIVRQGTSLIGYYSSNGTNWTAHNSVAISMAQNVYIGLCLTSHSGGVLCTAQFDNVSTAGAVGGDLKDKMLGVNASLWTRINFTVEDPGFYDSLTLRMKYEDGFIAYLNGVKVASRNAPTTPLWNSTALSNRPIADSTVFEDINLLAYKGLLNPAPAKNVLAIHALNDAASNDEFFLLPELTVASNQVVPQYFPVPTPGTYNSAGVQDMVAKVWVSHDRGFYSSGFQATLTCATSGVTIRYTTDGSTPTITNGTVYTAPLSISQTTTLRAIATRPGWFDSPVETRTYLFLNDVKTQSPTGQAPGPGWPTGTVNGQTINYGMDPDIVNSPTYSGQIITALQQIPSISIVTDLKHLFDPGSGIYVNAYSDGRAWERPASIELLNPDGSQGFQIDAGLRIRGGYSRSGGNPKHAFRFFFRSEYGKSKLEYPLFGDEGATEFKKMDLRTSQNYSWSFDGSNQNTFIREVWSRDTEREMGQPTTRSRYYHLYINGQYWGLYQTQERAEADWAETYLGGDSGDYDTIKIETNHRQMTPTDGDMEMFTRFHGIAVQGFLGTGNYWKLQGLNPDGTQNPAFEKHLDVDNVIDEMIIEYYTGDRDGPGSRYGNVPNNTKAIGNRVEPDGWVWPQHDSEHSLGTGENDLVNPLTTAGAQLQYFNHQWLHEQMTADVDYRMRFADRVQKHLFNGGLLTAERGVARVNNRASQIDMAIIAESARWGDSKREPPYTKVDWENAVNGIRSFIITRIPTLLSQFRGRNWFPAIDAPTLNVQSGLVSPGALLIISGSAGTTYYTTDGTDPRVPAAQSTGGAAVTLIAENAVKRFHIPTGEVASSTGSILAEYWYGIGGTAISDLTSNPRYPDSPDQRSYLTTFEIPVDAADTYGTRVRGWLHPPTTATYTFWIATDDNGELWLSSDESPANVTRICRVDTWTPSRSWDSYTSQRSAGINLVAGRKYYIEAFMKEHGGGDNLSVAWRGGPISTRQIIAGQYLSPAGIGWIASDYDDGAWGLGLGGVGYETETGYEPYFNIDVRDAMYNKNSTCYIRIPFSVANTELSSLKLRVRYDDGFIAYLNGREVKRVNFDAAATPAWNSAANASHDDAAAVQFEEFDITEHISTLRTGSNLLAIQGLNVSAGSTDFLISVELKGTELSQGDIHPSAQAVTTLIPINQTMHLKARSFNGIWSALTEAVYATQDLTDKLRITEIMYHPVDTGDPQDPVKEFIELTNISGSTIDLFDVQFTNGIRFTFPRMSLAPGGFTVVVADMAAFQSEYGTGVNVAGQYEGRLDNSGERIRLADALDRTILDFRYKDGWRPTTDGGGFSLTLIDASNPDPNSWGLKDSWRASAMQGGSPGWDDSGLIPNPGAVVINEVLAHSHAEAADWIELHNTTAAPINIGGWFLSDKDGDATSLMKYMIAEGTVIPAGGYIVFYQNLHFGAASSDPGVIVPFALSENGEEVVLSSGQGGVLTGYRDYEDFGPSATGVSFGRYQKSDGSFNFVSMSTATPGAANAYPLVGPIVINEIMYNPASGNQNEEYIELHNITSSPVTLFDYLTNEPWKFTDGIQLTFPSDSPITIPAHGYLLVVKDPAAYVARYGAQPAGVQVIKYDDGSLDNGGERIELSMPGDVDNNGKRYYIRVDRVNYSDGSHPVGSDPWPVLADGLGASLSRITPANYGNDVVNWKAANPSPGLANP